MKIREISKIYETYDYDVFKTLEGNREVRKRKKKVERSVDNVGYIPIPIVVNEKYEIIDGAARFEYCVENGLPIIFTVIPNLGLKECVAINTASTNWNTMDYIKSYADSGNDSYIRLYKLVELYGNELPLLSIWNAATEMLSIDRNIVNDGKLSLTSDCFQKAIIMLDFDRKFKQIFDRVGGRKELYYSCLNYLVSHNVLDVDRLEKKIIERQATLYPVISIDQAFTVIEEVYNHCARTRAYLLTSYKQYMDSKYSWYRKRYGG